MKTKLVLTAVVAVLIGALSMSAIPAISYMGDPAKPGPFYVDENKDGICDHAKAGTTAGVAKDENAQTGWNCPRAGGKWRGKGMYGGKMCPRIQADGADTSEGQAK